MKKTSKKEELQESFMRYATFPKTKISYMTLRKLRAIKSRVLGDAAGWNEYLTYLSKDANLSPTLHERVQFGTFTTLLNMWMRNLADNLSFIRSPDAKTIADLAVLEPLLETEADYKTSNAPSVKKNGINIKHPVQGSAIIVGRGPSLFEHKHCEMLQKSNYKGAIVASDGGLIPLLEGGVIPDYVVTVDGAPIIKKYFDHPLVREHGSKIKWICTTTINHEVMLTSKETGMQIYWFSPIFDDAREQQSFTRQQKLLTSTDHNEHGVPRASSGGNSGACAWVMASMVLKRSPCCLIGIDFGYPENVSLEKTHYYKQILKEADNDVGIIKEAYKQFYHPTWKKKAYVDLVFYHYRQAFLELQQFTPLWYQLYGGTINCTEGGTLFGAGITCMSFKEFLERYRV